MDKLQITNKKPSELFNIENPRNPLDEYDANGDPINKVEIVSTDIFNTGGVTGMGRKDEPVEEISSGEENNNSLEEGTPEQPADIDKKKEEPVKVDDKSPDNTVIQGLDFMTDYRSILTSLMDRKIIPAISPDDELEIEDGVVVKFKDLKIESSDEFLDYVESLFDEQRNSMLENKIDASAISDITKTIIEIDKNGGNIEDIKKALNIFGNQVTLDGLDPDNITDAEMIVREFYTRKGEDEGTIKEQITLFKSAGEDYLKAKAEKFKDVMVKVDQQELERAKQAAIEREKAWKNYLQEYRKNLKSSLKTNFQLNENYIGKVTDFGTARDKEGYTGAQKVFNDLTADPAKAAELYLYLFNKDEYIKQKSNVLLKAKSEQTRKLIRTSNSSRRSTDTTQIPEKLVENKSRGLEDLDIVVKDIF